MSGPPRPSALAPFAVPGFRFLWPGDLLTSWAFEMETLILGWYVLTETGSVLALTVFGALQYLGTLVGPLVGVAGDRIGHRNLLCGMRAFYAALAALLTALAFAGVLTPALVLAVTALSGVIRPSDQGTRAALAGEIMPTDRLVSAMSISRTTSDSARIAGAIAGAGLFAALGMGPAYLVVTAFYALGVALTFAVGPSRRAPAAGPRLRSPWGDLREGIAYIWATPHLCAAMWFAFLANLAAFPLTNGLVAYVAKDVYGADQTGFGYLAASGATGALLGSMMLSIVGHRVRPARMMLAFAAAWYAVLLVFAHMQDLAGGIATLMLAGLLQNLSMVPLTVILLRFSGDRFRGRVMGVRMLAIYSLPLGLLVAGALIDLIGFRATALVYSGTGLLLTAVAALRWRRVLWPPDAEANAR